ncbi:hypothetical protein RHGRI_008722 [Rhododendron griersonianum]|uniref:Uncharacterized protein n=1 Tax=Rhododendron griersonianum TaxID=479676 RepID=A0AAV6L3S3_9ERIC|nr:hypothetical protein RHGRI_008722 [Rhododendron griersonianum]
MGSASGNRCTNEARKGSVDSWVQLREFKARRRHRKVLLVREFSFGNRCTMRHGRAPSIRGFDVRNRCTNETQKACSGALDAAFRGSVRSSQVRSVVRPEGQYGALVRARWPSFFQEEKNPKENPILWLLWCLVAIERWTPLFVTVQQKAKLFLPPTGNSAVKCLMNIEYPTLQELTVNLLTHDFEVDYESEENAQIVYSALAVDKELQPDKVKRQMTVSNGKLVVHFEAVEARFLRASFSAFVDVLTLATKTIEEFGQGMEL